MKKYVSKFKEATIPLADAYWINPIGKILPITDKFGQGKHIDTIVQNPKAFGLTMDQVQAMYDLEGEKLGIEGKAREKIIKDLISKGWIRIRWYKKQDIWTINVNKLTNKVKQILYTFAKTMVDKYRLKFSGVKIDIPNKVIHTSFSDIVNEALLNESIEEFEFIVCKSVDDLL
jgi:hypothetical protein